MKFTVENMLYLRRPSPIPTIASQHPVTLASRGTRMTPAAGWLHHQRSSRAFRRRRFSKRVIATAPYELVPRRHATRPLPWSKPVSMPL